MTAAGIAWLAASGATFLLWAGYMFLYLFRLRADASARHARAGGGLVRHYGQVLATFRDFLLHPHYRRERNRLGLLTLLMVAVLLARLFFIPAPA